MDKWHEANEGSEKLSGKGLTRSRVVPNKALQRRPRSAVLIASFHAARGPAERRR